MKAREAGGQKTHSYCREEPAIWLGTLDFHPENEGEEAGVGSSVPSVRDSPKGAREAGGFGPGKMGQQTRGEGTSR